MFYTLSNGKLNRDADQPAGAVWCVDAATGERLWEIATAAGQYAGPVCYDRHVFIAGGNGLCQCLRQNDGGPVWQTPLGQRIVASPIVSGGAMFVMTQDGRLVKLDAATGRIVWDFDDIDEYVLNRDAHASPILHGGRIYLAAGGRVFCIGDRGE